MNRSERLIAHLGVARERVLDVAADVHRGAAPPADLFRAIVARDVVEAELDNLERAERFALWAAARSRR